MSEGAARGAEPAFALGERVRARTADPDGHTRLPRYVRGHAGRIVEVTGRWPLADEVAGRHPAPRVEPVYTVAFAADELWGAGSGGHEVTVDLWESYLERDRGREREQDRERELGTERSPETEREPETDREPGTEPSGEARTREDGA